ncbi:hypothetical protein BDN70DRAFT_138020 [Pholiota conissans]|uniref:Uncharacterized protein n=1 Tax=Pholiota conissans TaxID=109636 RepID=A0A9P5YZJ5_9AGAR|nr:hypothetical protein BDN70DRAFT_138020 [Pholiota conissans]
MSKHIWKHSSSKNGNCIANYFCNAYAHEQGFKRINLNFPTHLWLLAGALPITREDADLRDNLQKYTVASSYKRILRRVTTFQSFIKTLASIDHIPSLSGASKVAPKDNSRARQFEHRFLVDIVYPSITMSGIIDADIPDIRRLAQEAHRIEDNLNKGIQHTSSEGPYTPLYTDETRVQFHAMLTEFLERVKNNLVALDEMSKHTLDHKKFMTEVGHLQRNGYALWRLSRSHALQMHLINIQNSLVDHRPIFSKLIPGEGDTDIGMAMSLDGKTLLESYAGCLQLIISHFDAFDMVIRHLQQNKYNRITVKILVAPTAKTTLSDWKGIESLLPRQYDPNIVYSNDQINSFMTAGLDIWNLKTVFDKVRTCIKQYKLGQVIKTNIISSLAESTNEEIVTLVERISPALDKYNEEKEGTGEGKADPSTYQTLGPDLDKLEEKLLELRSKESESEGLLPQRAISFFKNISNNTFKGDSGPDIRSEEL